MPAQACSPPEQTGSAGLLSVLLVPLLVLPPLPLLVLVAPPLPLLASLPVLPPLPGEDDVWLSPVLSFGPSDRADASVEPLSLASSAPMMRGCLQPAAVAASAAITSADNSVVTRGVWASVRNLGGSDVFTGASREWRCVAGHPTAPTTSQPSHWRGSGRRPGRALHR